MNPCTVQSDSATTGRGGGGGGFGGGGGLGGPGPFVLPGTYTVALTNGGKVLDSKPLKVAFDPDVHFAAGEHEHYNMVVADLHEMQRKATAAASALNTVYGQLADVSKKVNEKSDIPANVKSQVETFSKEMDATRKKFGVPLNQNAGGRGGGGGRGGAVDPENVLAREAGLKQGLMGVWEAPSASMVRQYNEVKLALPKAVSDANALLAKAVSLSQTLKKYDITLTVPK
jgi:hypothetical protein